MRATRVAFQSLVDALEHAQDEAALRAAASRAAQHMGLRWFAYLGFDAPVLEALTSYPAAWTDRYLAHGYDQFDPVVFIARRRQRAFRWDAGISSHRGVALEHQIFDEAREFGIRSGVTVPIRGGYERFAMFTLAGDERDPSLLRGIEEDLDTLQLMGLYFHAHVYAKLQLRLTSEQVVSLTPRERQCLSWVARGKTMPEIAEIVGVSRRTVLFHLENARRKLNGATLAHAVAQAIRLNLISH